VPVQRHDRPDVAFVLGGGGVLGAAEVGMLRALMEHEIRPDVVLGTSIGAVNGALIAARPETSTIDRMQQVWENMSSEVFGSMRSRLRTMARSGTHLHSNRPLRRLLAEELGDQRIEDLTVPFQCVAASIERAAEHWFTEGPLLEAILASSAVPGMFPPAFVAGEHYIDGGLVHSIPVGRAVALGAQTVFVLQVGRVDQPLEPPRRPWEVAAVAFEVARRHRYAADMASIPDSVDVHVLPTGRERPPNYADLSTLKYWDSSRVSDRITSAYEASMDALAKITAGR
jgi:NTE family protein